MDTVRKSDVIRSLEEIPDEMYIDPNCSVEYKKTPYRNGPASGVNWLQERKWQRPRPTYSEVMHQLFYGVYTNWHRRDTCHCLVPSGARNWYRYVDEEKKVLLATILRKR